MVNDLGLSDRPFDREAIKNSSRYRAFTVFLKVIGDSSNLNESYTITRDLPQHIDNQLYFLSHYIGGFTTTDVVNFVKKSSRSQIKRLISLLNRVPSDQYELIPLAGMYKSIYESPDYQKLISLILGTLTEDVDVDAQGYYTTDTNPYFTQYVTPEIKKQIFGYWDKHGVCYDCLKYFGVNVDEENDYEVTFKNIMDIVYPLLYIEYIGGIENTEFAKLGYSRTNEGGWAYLKFNIEPVNYDYMFDESENYGEHGYACWDIRINIDKDSDLTTDTPPASWDEPFIQTLFPESARNKLTSFRNYNDDQMETIEMLWEHYVDNIDFTPQFCRVEVVLV